MGLIAFFETPKLGSSLEKQVFQGVPFPFFPGILLSRNLQRPKENGWLLKRTMVEKNGESAPRVIGTFVGFEAVWVSPEDWPLRARVLTPRERPSLTKLCSMGEELGTLEQIQVMCAWLRAQSCDVPTFGEKEMGPPLSIRIKKKVI